MLLKRLLVVSDTLKMCSEPGSVIGILLVLLTLAAGQTYAPGMSFESNCEFRRVWKHTSTLDVGGGSPRKDVCGGVFLQEGEVFL